MSTACKSHVESSKWTESNSKDQQNKIFPVPEEKGTFCFRNRCKHFVLSLPSWQTNYLYTA